MTFTANVQGTEDMRKAPIGRGDSCVRPVRTLSLVTVA